MKNLSSFKKISIKYGKRSGKKWDPTVESDMVEGLVKESLARR